jgi:hypothetical protein
MECPSVWGLWNENLQWVFLYWGLWKKCTEGSGDGTSFFIKRICNGNLEGEFLFWGLWKICKEGTGFGTSFSMSGFRKGNLMGEFLFYGLWKIWKEGSGKATFFLCRGSLRGTWKVFLFWGLCETCQGRLWNRCISLLQRFCQGTWREGSHTEESERRVPEGSGNGVILFAGAPQREPKGI